MCSSDLLNLFVEWGWYLLPGGELVSLTMSPLGLYHACGFRGSTFERFMSAFGSAQGALFSTYLLHIFGKLYAVSENFICQLHCSYEPEGVGHQYPGRGRRQRTEWEIQRRVVRSLRPFRVRMSSLYVVDTTSSVEYWDVVVDKAITLLCLFPPS